MERDLPWRAVALAKEASALLADRADGAHIVAAALRIDLASSSEMPIHLAFARPLLFQRVEHAFGIRCDRFHSRKFPRERIRIFQSMSGDGANNPAAVWDILE